VQGEGEEALGEAGEEEGGRASGGQAMRRPATTTTAVAFILCLSFAGTAVAEPSERPFELVPGSFHFVPSTGQAAAHADWVTSFDFAHEANGRTDNDLRSTVVNLPAGFIGNNTAVPTCTQAQLLALWQKDEEKNENKSSALSDCPPASQVGLITLEVIAAEGGGLPAQLTVPLYNMEVTSFGITAELGFKASALVQTLQIGVRPGDSGITVTTPKVPKFSEPHNVRVTVWGVPASHEHDAQRGEICGIFAERPPVCHQEYGGPKAAGVAVRPFLSNPTSCGIFTASMAAYSWEEPEQLTSALSETAPVGECDRVPFEPSVEVQPTTSAVESPSGLNISLVVPQSWENPFSISTAHLKDTRLALPVGYTINPGAGSGLGVCTLAQLEAETSLGLPGEGCPQESKIGTVGVETPVLAEKLEGAIYVAKPFEAPFTTSLLQIYIVVRSPQRGIVVRLKGSIEANPVTGQLVTTFLNNPQVPFSRFTLKLRQGATSPLVSPPACGSYIAQADLTPWSGPLSPQHVSSPPFQVETGIGGGPCPVGGVPPFHPGLVAGTLNNNAGAYSPLNLRITRNDGEQELTRFSSQFPPGLSARLTGVPFCPDASIEAAKHTSGAQQETEPSCPAASAIGHTLVGAGVGPVLAWTPGKVYMAGPYNGAPFSIVAITSAKVGPFDLGTVVVREALKIDPITAAVTVDAAASDPIPHIIEGIVIHVRDIRVSVDRPSFMINPTSCERMSLAATVDGAGADPSNPVEQPATITSPFQLANCQNLQFKPSFKASVTGKTSKAGGAGLKVNIAYPNTPQGTEANIHAVKVELPIQLPSRLTTLQKACLAAVFEANPASCPPGSIVGQARAVTPILPVPLTGPAYFVSYGNAKFPELVIVLQGYGITIDLHGETFISKKGITSSTFHQVPDQPVTSFELNLPQASNSALAANVNLCAPATKVVKRHGKRVRVSVRRTLNMPTEMTAQNGMVLHQATPIAITGCGKAKGKKAKKARRKR
jgi:hypothetical protein